MPTQRNFPEDPANKYLKYNFCGPKANKKLKRNKTQNSRQLDPASSQSPANPANDEDIKG